LRSLFHFPDGFSRLKAKVVITPKYLNMPITDTPRLILCPDLASYYQVLDSLNDRAAARLNVPIITGEASPLKGFPPHLPALAFSDWPGPGSPGPVELTPSRPDKKRRVCLALAEEPACVAVSRYLCLASGKELVLSAGGPEWEATVLGLLADAQLQSLTLLLPSWKDSALDPGWLLRVLNLMRSAQVQKLAPNLSWGLITGTEAAVISQLAAKAVLQPEIIATYRAASTVIISNYARETLNTPLERVSLHDRRAGLELFDQKWIDEGFPRQVLKQPLQALIFKGHGRNYCALDGYLCGARPLTQDPETPPSSCVLGMKCAARTFPQLDPRTYDTPVMVMDSCGTGNWAAYVWQTGLPSLAFYAVAGAPGAVITEDGVTINGAEDYLDTIWALISAPTMGHVTARFNQARRQDNPIPPYFLLGDPDIPAGTNRWPEFATTLSELAPLPPRQPGGALWLVPVPPVNPPFLRLQLPRPGPIDDEAVTFVWSLQEEVRVNNARVYRFEGDLELFLSFERRPPAGATLLVERAACPALPPGLLKAAMDLPLILDSWLEPLAEARLPLLEAARQVVKTAQLLEKIEGQAVTFSFNELQSVLNDTRTAWLKAHLKAIRTILKFAPFSLWPSSLWTTYNYRGEELDKACPHCGLAPTILRTGQTVPGLRLPRQGLECLRCDLVEDLPGREDNPTLSMPVPAKIFPGQYHIELEIDNTAGGTTFWGAGAILMDRSGHGVSASPESFVVEVKGGEKFKTGVTLTLPGDPPVSHQYRVRAVILLNGDWFWLSRTVIVYGHQENENNLPDN
jgi:hypothetical protein